MLRRASFALAVLLAPATLLGCGDDDDRLTSQEFLTRANAVCQNLNVELQRETTALLAEDKDALSDSAKLARYFLDTALPVARKKLDGLEKLKPPERDEEAFEEVIAEGRAAVNDVEDALRENPASLLEGDNPLGDFDEMARELGLTGCAAAEKPSEQRERESTSTTGS